MKIKVEPTPQLPLLPLALLYFVLFLVSLIANQSEHLFLFPKVQADFFHTLSVDILFSVFVAGLIIVFFQVIEKTTRLFTETSELFSRLFGHLTPSECFLVAAFSSIGEEFFFRGLCQSYFGIFLTSLIFALAHVGPRKSFWPWTLSAGILSLLLGYMYQLTQNLLVPTVTHFVINFINLSLMRYKASLAEDCVKKNPIES